MLESTAQGFPSSQPGSKADLTPVATTKAHQNLALGQRSIKIRYDELFGQLELLQELSAAPGSPATTGGPFFPQLMDQLRVGISDLLEDTAAVSSSVTLCRLHGNSENHTNLFTDSREPVYRRVVSCQLDTWGSHRYPQRARVRNLNYFKYDDGVLPEELTMWMMTR